MTNEKNPCTITVPCRFSYLTIWEPKAMEEGQQKKYSASLIIPKTDKKTIKQIEAAIDAAKIAGKDSKFGGKVPSTLKISFYDGDEAREEDEAYEKSMYLSARASTRPGIVDSSRSPITDQDEFQSGDYGFANITFYPYNSGGSKGIAVGLNHVMKTKTGERLSGRVSVDDAFGDVEVNDEAADLL